MQKQQLTEVCVFAVLEAGLPVPAFEFCQLAMHVALHKHPT